MGVYGSCEDIGVVIGSALGGFAWSALGSSATFFLVGVTASVLGAIVALTLPKVKAV